MLNGLDKLSDKGKSIPTHSETSRVTHSKLNPMFIPKHLKILQSSTQNGEEIDKVKCQDSSNVGDKACRTWASITEVKKQGYAEAFPLLPTKVEANTDETMKGENSKLNYKAISLLKNKNKFI
uniref:Uncharacterized protein n=1 Tax=Meloidogyne enterolobii TaxID=390850 RepID=A0A6V7WKI5_MELEN|nr:unnamed protein product [Meloidogyne enterolobii]